MTPENLKARTLAAFESVPKPTFEELTPHQCDECDRLRSALHPYTSTSVPADVLDRHRWDLPLLSADAKHYYLPAWLLRSIDEPRSDYTDALLMALDSDHRWVPEVPYSEDQWDAVVEYLELIDELKDHPMWDYVARVKERLNVEP